MTTAGRLRRMRVMCTCTICLARCADMRRTIPPPKQVEAIRRSCTSGSDEASSGIKPWLAIALCFAAGKSNTASDGDDHVDPIAGEDDSCDPATAESLSRRRRHRVRQHAHLGRRLRACHDGCKDGRCQLTCSDDGVKLIYLVDDRTNDFLSFDPRKLPDDPFHLIGKLQCADRGSPFSMSVDRHGMAWVVYDDGELFKVSIDDAHCSPTSFSPDQAGSLTFGMGFSTDTPGGKTEKLYLAANDFSHILSALDPASVAIARRGVLSATDEGNPELTGTSDAKLYGFYPVESSAPFVQEIDRATGGPVGPRWPIGRARSAPSRRTPSPSGAARSTCSRRCGTRTSTRTRRSRTVDRSGHYKTIMQQLPYRITGAGVSTCAPERDQ